MLAEANFDPNPLQVAAYPFTTLMPNLGVLRTGGDAEQDYSDAGGAAAILADLPGLIQGRWPQTSAWRDVKHEGCAAVRLAPAPSRVFRFCQRS